MMDGEKEINLIKNMVGMSGNISITSMGEVTTNNTSGEKTADRNQIISERLILLNIILLRYAREFS